MADNKTGDEIIRELEFGDSNKEDILEELVTEDIKIESTDDNVKYDDNNEEIQSEISNSENDTIQEELEEDEIPVQKKQSKIFRILIGAIAILSIVLTIGIILYFSGFFDPEEKIEKKVQKEVKDNTEVVFTNSAIDKNKLNKKLTMLTKHEIMEKEALEAEAKKKKEEQEKKALEEKMEKEKELRAKIEKEQKKLVEEQKKKLEEKQMQEEVKRLAETKKLIEKEKALLKAQQEEFLKLQEEQKNLLEEQRLEILEELKKSNQKDDMKKNDILKDTSNFEESNAVEEEIHEERVETSPNSFLSFINVATVDGKLYKSFLDKIENIEKSISLCRDNKNRIEVYFGPYDSNKERNKIFEKLSADGFKDAYLIEFTQEEYNKRCKY